MGNYCNTCKTRKELGTQEIVTEIKDTLFLNENNEEENESSTELKWHNLNKHVDKIIRIQSFCRGHMCRKNNINSIQILKKLKTRKKGIMAKRFNSLLRSKDERGETNEREMGSMHFQIDQNILVSNDFDLIGEMKFEQNVSDRQDGESSFNDTTRTSKQQFVFTNGAIYKGDWKLKKRHGYGMQLWSDGAKYIGYWRDNKAHGKGIFYHVDGDVFDGEWADDKANGYGIYTHVNGAKYIGYWNNDLQHGKGKETWVDGSSFEGEYAQGKKHGLGHYIWSDGASYEGYWSQNKIHGKGTYKWKDGRKYEGDWVDNKMHGYGVYSWNDGRQYEGQYQMDKKEGKGKYTWADGRHYDGMWLDGKQHGEGKYILPSGIVKIGIWQNGRRIKWINEFDSSPQKDNKNTHTNPSQ